jgi:hypothetical protein
MIFTKQGFVAEGVPHQVATSAIAVTGSAYSPPFWATIAILPILTLAGAELIPKINKRHKVIPIDNVFLNIIIPSFLLVIRSQCGSLSLEKISNIVY